MFSVDVVKQDVEEGTNFVDQFLSNKVKVRIKVPGSARL